MNCLTERHVCVYLLFCIMHGSVVLGNDEQQCIDDVYTLFPKRENPRQYFVTAFAKHNQAYFDHPTPNVNARGYFENLLSGVRHIRYLTSSPSAFCARFLDVTDITACDEALYMLFANKDLNREEEVTRILNMTEIEAFKYVYLTHILNDLTFDKVYPQQYESTLEGYRVASEQKTEEDEKRQIIRKMREYFNQLFSAANTASIFSEFRSVEEYCAAVTVAAAVAATASDAAPAADTAPAALGIIVQRCIDDVYTFFNRSECPRLHFVTAFKDYNQAYFNRPTPNINACGYFEDLIKRVEEVGDYISSPKEYCEYYENETEDREHCDEAMYMLFADKALDPKDEKTRISSMTKLAAFKHVYLNYILSELQFNKVFPQEREPTIEDLGGDKVKNFLARQRKLEEYTKKKNIFKNMKLYYVHFLNATDTLAQNARFRVVKEYCAADAVSAKAAADAEPIALDK